ncbi:MFS transporter [Rhodococcus sp. NPDC057135]|uniref:MFS transporter n=1 Tax=Rhodococcus sp. NPDC057135 TaxID=3346028 RepID=UPI00363829A0
MNDSNPRNDDSTSTALDPIALTVHEQPAAPKKTSQVRAVAAATIGNALEWYDMTIYALLAVYIGQNFFPSESSSVQLIQTFAVFAVSYVARPIGSLIIGAYIDRHGIKKGLLITIRLMVIGTAIIAFMPTHETIGIFAPLGIILGRIIQGISTGGEIGASTALLVAQNQKRRGFLGSFQPATQGLATVVAALMVAVLSGVLSSEDMYNWGWRIPFIFGLLVGPAGYFIRRYVPDVPHARAQGSEPTSSARVLFRSEKASILIAGGILAVSTAVQAMLQYIPTYAITQLNMPSQLSFGALVIAGLILTFVTPFVGHLSDKTGRVRLMIPTAIGIGVLIIPLFVWALAARSFAVLVIVISLLAVMKAVYFAALPTVMMDSFTPATGVTGMAFTYNTAIPIFGGLTPMVVTFLIQATGQPIAPAYYVSGIAVISITALIFAARTRNLR